MAVKKTGGKRAAVEFRRARVMALLVRKPGVTHAEIASALTEGGITNPLKAGAPWSLATINADIKALNVRWQQEASRDISELKAQQLARLYELLAIAYREKRYELALRIEERIAKLLGLDAPARVEATGADGRDLLPIAELVAVFQRVAAESDDADGTSGGGG